METRYKENFEKVFKWAIKFDKIVLEYGENDGNLGLKGLRDGNAVLKYTSNLIEGSREYEMEIDFYLEEEYKNGVCFKNQVELEGGYGYLVIFCNKSSFVVGNKFKKFP